MNKNEFLSCLSGRVPYNKDEVAFLFDIIADIISDGLRHDGQVRTPLGAFKLVKRKARRIRDIHSGKIKILPEKVQIQFIPSEKLKN